MSRWCWVLAVGCSSSSPSSVPLDAPPPPDAFADMDSDGIADPDDLCPTLADPDNYDHDSDGLGDPCDPCPHLATNDDTDGDGVGDLCDPHPAQAIDQRVGFYGFYAAAEIATWEQTGTWTVDDGKLVTEATDVSAARIVNPATFGSDIVISAGVEVLALSTSQSQHRTASILALRGSAPVMLHACGLDQIASTAELRYQILNATTNVGSSGTLAFPGPVVADHDFKLGFAASTGTCSVSGRTANRASGTPASGQIGVDAVYAHLAVDFMFVVESN